MSIKLKINLSFMFLGILSVIAVALFNYIETRKEVFLNAFEKAELINSFALAARTYTVKTMRPLALKVAGPNQFHPEIMGGFFVARAIADNFGKNQPGYSFKQATTNPVNIENRADIDEEVIIAKLSENRELSMDQGILEKNYQRYFYIAKPVVAAKGCLKCHGDPSKAPYGRRTRYPGSGGYNYKENSVIAAFITYIPVEEALSEIKISTFKLAGTTIAIFCVIFIVIWLLVDRIVTKPIVNLTRFADEISRGQKLENKLSFESKDEIGVLYQSFDRLRQSVVKLMGLIKK
jgi:HAMP domain-containing protein